MKKVKIMISLVVAIGLVFNLFAPNYLFALRVPGGTQIVDAHMKSGESAVSPKEIYNKINAIQKFADNEDLLSEEQAKLIVDLFRQLKVMDGSGKQALLYYLLCQSYRPVLKGEKIIFEGIDSEDVSIVDGQLEARERIVEGIAKIVRFKIFADLDENLAPRKKDFPESILKILEKMAMYGVAPAIVSDNEWSNVESRMKKLPPSIRELWREIYADGAANQYDANGKLREEYAEEIGAAMSEDEFERIKAEMFGGFIEIWQTFALKLTEYLKERSKEDRGLKNLPALEDVDGVIKIINEVGIREAKLKTVAELLATKLNKDKLDEKGVVEYLIGIADRIGDERARAIDSIQKLLEGKEAKEEVHFTFYQVFDVIETIRVLKSEEKLSENDKEEYNRLEAKKDLVKAEKTKFQSLKAVIAKKSLDAVEKQAIKDSILAEKPEILECKLRTGVQIAVKPIRTICVRNALTNYFAKKLDKLQRQGGKDGEMFQKFRLYQGGQTTINIKHKGISKATPLKRAIEEGLLIIYSGDEVRFSCSLTEAREGTDTSVALLLAEEDNEDKLMVFATSRRKPADDLSRKGFYWTKEFSLTKDAKSGPEANALLYQNILGIMEEELGKLLTDKNHQAGSALEIFRKEVNLSLSQSNSKYSPENNSSFFLSIGMGIAQSVSFGIGLLMGWVIVKYVNSKKNRVEPGGPITPDIAGINRLSSSEYSPLLKSL
ncbi:MAG: hypothetical protein ABII74_00815 [Elusimicrobiota bacterium]